MHTHSATISGHVCTCMYVCLGHFGSLAGPTLYQPRGKERVWSNPIHDLVSTCQRFGGGHAQNVTIRHGSQTIFFARALAELE